MEETIARDTTVRDVFSGAGFNSAIFIVSWKTPVDLR